MPKQTTHPNIEWNGKTIFVTLPDNRGQVIKARWNPSVTSVVRIREAGAGEWSPGFETPLTHCQFAGLKPDTEYQCEVRFKNAAGEGEPAYTSIRTGSEGAIENIIPVLPTQ
ncbi:MAG: fibronectin type III domain-containing protein [Bryobacterales bacterium]|nr:fibronectin type III domain-containing protein [Bryobacterales bacterium]